MHAKESRATTTGMMTLALEGIDEQLALYDRARDEGKPPELWVIESGIFHVMKHILAGNIRAHPDWRVVISDGYPAAFVHTSFSTENPGFIAPFLPARSRALSSAQPVFSAFQQAGLCGPISSVPVCLIMADEAEALARALSIPQAQQIDPVDIQRTFDRFPYLKASEQFIFGSTHPGKDNQDRDFVGFAKRMSQEWGMSLEDFLYRQQFHEILQLFSHRLTMGRYAHSTWLNEGMGDVLADFFQRSVIGIRDTVVPLRFTALTTNMPGTNTIELHAKAALLVRAIAHAYEPADTLKGIIAFLQRLFRHDSESSGDLNEDVRALLTRDRMWAAIEAKIDYLQYMYLQAKPNLLNPENSQALATM